MMQSQLTSKGPEKLSLVQLIAKTKKLVNRQWQFATPHWIWIQFFWEQGKSVSNVSDRKDDWVRDVLYVTGRDRRQTSCTDGVCCPATRVVQLFVQ